MSVKVDSVINRNMTLYHITIYIFCKMLKHNEKLKAFVLGTNASNALRNL